MTDIKKKEREPLVQISKRTDMPKWQAWLIRGGAVIAALFIGAVVAAILVDGQSFGLFFKNIFEGVFGTERRIWNLLQNGAVMLIIALALAPAFRMRFWNIGAEGQVLMGGLACVVCIKYFGDKVNEPVLLLIMAAMSIAFGAAWAVIPAIFKAQWNTNETLFTLMMNYIAMQLVSYCICIWVPNGSGVLGRLPYGHFPTLGGYNYLLNVLIAVIGVVVLFIYMRFSKHGYELAVVGESMNTAKYVGINVKKVIIRTMILSGVLCGVAGLVLVAGTNHSLSVDAVGGRGFTAILVAWLGKFNPLIMVGTSLLYVFIDQGTAYTAVAFQMSDSFADIITGIFFFLVIACEFFVNYRVRFRFLKGRKKDGSPAAPETESAEEGEESLPAAETEEEEALPVAEAATAATNEEVTA